MPTTCVIEFDNNPTKFFNAGQLLKGKVRINFQVRKHVRRVYIIIHGSAFAHWREARKSCEGNEDYLNDITYFVGGKNESTIVLPPGTHKYTFQCTLPNDLPSSIEGSCGYIRYTAKVVLEMSMWGEMEFEEQFIVIQKINLDTTPSLGEPVSYQLKERIYPYYLLCYVSDPVTINVIMPLGLFNPGDFVNLEINAKNISNQPFYRFVAKLIRSITFYCYTKSKHHKNEKVLLVEKVSEEGCGVKQNKIIRMNVKIPQTPPTNTISNIIKVRYFIRLIAVTPFLCSTPTLDIPIVIGSYSYQTEIEPVSAEIVPAQVEIIPDSLSNVTDDVILQQPTSANNTDVPIAANITVETND